MIKKGKKQEALQLIGLEDVIIMMQMNTIAMSITAITALWILRDLQIMLT